MRAVLILGQPSADFIHEINLKYNNPELKIIQGSDFQSARDFLLSDIFNWTLSNKPLVITNSSGWNADIQVLTEIFAHATGRSPEAIQYYLFDMGVEVKSQALRNELLSIKDIMKNIDQTKLTEKQRLKFQVLGELIR